ncbi:alpha/beta hydrolase, partial [uncultured Nevskia sp.]|uniref:alpha/beta fold hydrolase n=1 Tax=uncultured Nevskia sp. TaxID=228950 RepID=UPI0025E003FB
MSDASTWVLLRGLMRDSRHWGDFPQAFASEMSGARIELLDFPGNGALNEQTSASSVDAMADYCRAELQRRGLKPPYRLLAMSLGAMAASSWASRYPQELDACVLINTSLRPFRSRMVAVLITGIRSPWVESRMRSEQSCARPRAA